MSSLTQALSVALSGLQTSTSLIAVASANISNAQTAGYTAKSATVSSVQYGDNAGGATISSYSRATDTALTNNYNAATAQAAYAGTLNTYMTQVQNILGATTTTPALTNDIAQFSAVWSTYSADPTSNTQQQAVVTAGQQLTADIQSITAQAASLKTQVQNDTAATVTTLNADLKQVAALNAQIQQTQTANGAADNLLDQRDTLVNQIAGLVSVNIQNRSTGQIALYTTTGQLLVDSGTALQFSTNGTSILDPHGNDVTGAMTGGALQAETDFNSTSAAATASTTPGVGVLAKLQAQLSTLVGAFTATTPATSFSGAYAASVASSTAAGGIQNATAASVAPAFFTVVANPDGSFDPSTFAVNPGLVDGTLDLPEAKATAIANSFNSTASYTAPGLKVNSATYADLGSAVLSSFQQAASSLTAQSTSLSSQQTYFKTTLSSETGVNIDTELANLVAYQNSYAASAHVISTVNQMLTSLMSTLSG